jgi:hypothetical protein
MSRDWSQYNEELVKRVEILIEPPPTKDKKESKKKIGRPSTYSQQLILMLLFIKFALRIPYRQTEEIARKIFGALGLKIPNFRTLHYRFTTSDLKFENVKKELVFCIQGWYNKHADDWSSVGV